MPAPGPTQVWCRSRVYPGCLPSHNPGKALSRVFPGWLCGGLFTILWRLLGERGTSNSRNNSATGALLELCVRVVQWALDEAI